MCAEEQHQEMQRVMNQSNPAETRSPLTVTEQDSPEEIKEKFRLMEEYVWR